MQPACRLHTCMGIFITDLLVSAKLLFDLADFSLCMLPPQA